MVDVINDLTTIEFLKWLATEKIDWKTYQAAVYERCRWDKKAFALIFFTDRAIRCPFAENHNEYFDIEAKRLKLSGTEKRNINRLFLWPRGGAKSTVITKIGSIHDICYRHEDYILLTSDTATQSKQKARSIRNEIKNNNHLCSVYGISPGEPWNQMQFKCNGVLFQATSVDSENRGFIEDDMRPSKVICDDIENSKSVLSAAERESTRLFFNDIVNFIGSSDCNIDVVGTKLHPESLIAELEKRPDYTTYKYRGMIDFPENQDIWDQWKQIYVDLDNPMHEKDAIEFYLQNRDIMDAGGRVLWPQNVKPKYPSKIYELMATRVEVGEGSFNKEIQNEPLDPERQIFDMDRAERFDIINKAGVRYIHRDNGTVIPVDSLVLYAVLDPAGPPKARRARTDYAAIAIVGRDDSGRFYVLDCWLKRAKSHEQATMCFELCSPSQWKVHVLRVKETGTMGLSYEMFRREKEDRQARGEWCDIAPAFVSENENKTERIAKLEPFITNNWICFNRKLPMEFYNQFSQFPNGDHDDAPDAVEEAVHLMRGSALR